MKKKEEVMVWSDKSGKYKVGYSQHLQQKTLQINTMLLICVIVLIVMMAVGAFYAHGLITRIDALDPIAKLAALQ